MTTELTKAAQQALMECPFCGSEPHDAHHIEYGRWAVTCRCGAKGASANTGPNATDAAKIKAYSDARTAWNTRALTQRPAAQTEREALRWTVSVEPVAVSGEPDAHCLLASIGNQAFHIGPDYMDTKREAEFFAEMFLHAIEVGHRASLPAAHQATKEQR